MNAEIVSVGTELLLGQIANTDAQYISQCLSEIGISVYYHIAVGDNWDRIKDSIDCAAKRSDIIILTGGLGPTVDDLTKEALCEYLDLETVEHKKSLERLLERFNKSGRTLTKNNMKQVLFPVDAVVLDNDCGTAPGMYYERNGQVFIALPGPPSELKPMFSNYVMPLLREKNSAVIKSRVLRVYGIGESMMETMVKDILDSQTNPTVAPLLGNGDVTLRITAMAQSEEEAMKLIEPMENKIRERLGEYIYGVDNDTPESVLVSLLKEKNMKFSAAESCTGGLIASRVTDIPGASDILKESLVTYSNNAKKKYLDVNDDTLKKYGAVSENTAYEMAVGALKNTESNISVAVTGNAGPSVLEDKSVGLVFIATAVKLDDKVMVNVKEYRFVGTRNKIKFSAATSAIIDTINTIKNMR